MPEFWRREAAGTANTLGIVRQLSRTIWAALLIATAVAGCQSPSGPAPSTTSEHASPPTPPPSAATPNFPRFEDFAAVPEETYALPGPGVWFATPTGASCGFGSSEIACYGTIPGAPAAANAVTVRFGQPAWFMKTTVKPPPQARPLQPGSRLSAGGSECVVGPAQLTACRVAGEPTTGFVTEAGTTALSPVPGLPSAFPDPRRYAIDGVTDYTVGDGAKNITRYFDVDGGLRCDLTAYSGVRIHCQGKIPGRGAVNRVALDLSELAWSHAEQSIEPQYPGPVAHLDQGLAVEGYGDSGLCMALYGGGVACYDGAQSAPHGFVITPTESWAFP